MAQKGGGQTVNAGPAPKKKEAEPGISGNSRLKGQDPSPDDRKRGETADSDRGRRPHIDRSGEVHGSGAGAGGGNPGEDYDDDVAAGGGEQPYQGARSMPLQHRSKDKHHGS